MERSNKKKIIIVVAIIILFILSFFVTKTIVDNKENKKQDNTINNVVNKEDNTTSDDNNSTKSKETNDKEKENVEETFLITFALENGTVLQSSNVKKGELPVYKGPTPIKSGYKFIGWNKTIKEASEATTYYAKFKKVEEEKEEKEEPVSPSDPDKPTRKYQVVVNIKTGQETLVDSIYISDEKYAVGKKIEIFATPTDSKYITLWNDGSTENPRTVKVKDSAKKNVYTAEFVEGFDLTYFDYNEKKPVTVGLLSNDNNVVIICEDKYGVEVVPSSFTVDKDLDISDDASYKPVSPEYTFKGFVYNGNVSPKTLTAKFEKKVTITAGVHNDSINYGTAYVTGTDKFDGTGKAANNMYDKNSEVYVYARPKNDNCDFVKWSDGNTENPRLANTSKNENYTAIFATDYNYMYFDNIGSGDGTVTMGISDATETIYVLNDIGKSKPKGEKLDDDCFDVDEVIDCIAPDVYLEYRVDTIKNDNGVQYDYGFWKDFNNPNSTSRDDVFIKVTVGKDQRICFRAKKIGNNYKNNHFCMMHDIDNYEVQHYKKKGTAYEDANSLVAANIFELGEQNFELGGAIMSLIDGKGNTDSVFVSNNHVNNYYTFGCLFLGNSKLTRINDKFKTPSTISIACYYATFQSCTELTTIPSKLLPATTLANSCYAYMFCNCAKLNAIPNGLLLAGDTEGSIAGRCYWFMFQDCIGLTNVPSNLLPATRLLPEERPEGMSEELFIESNQNCYRGMFSGCKNLESGPNLPATVLEPHCYEDMFKGCYKLTSYTLPAKNLADFCYQRMFAGCTSLNSLTVDFSEFDAGGVSNSTTDWLGTVYDNTEKVDVGPGSSGDFYWQGTTEPAKNTSHVLEGWTVHGATPTFLMNSLSLPFDNDFLNNEIVNNVETILDDEPLRNEFILKVDIIDDNVWYSVYEYNEESHLYDLVSNNMKTDIVEEHEYGLNYFYSDDEILDIDDILCEEGSLLISIQEA